MVFVRKRKIPGEHVKKRLFFPVSEAHYIVFWKQHLSVFRHTEDAVPGYHHLFYMHPVGYVASFGAEKQYGGQHLLKIVEGVFSNILDVINSK